MKAVHYLGLLVLGVALAVVGCGGGTSEKRAASNPQDTEGSAEIKTNLAKLSPEDRKLAEAQKVCPVSDEPLGSMGAPIKVTLQNEPVFLCCRSCRKKAEEQPEKSLARTKHLREKNAGGGK